MSEGTYRVVEEIGRPPETIVEAFRDVAAADVHEAMGKRNVMTPEISPATTNTSLCGSAVTVSLLPGMSSSLKPNHACCDVGLNSQHATR